MQMAGIIAFCLGMGITGYIVIRIWWNVFVRRDKQYQPESEGLLGYLYILGALYVFSSLILLLVLHYAYKPLPLSHWHMFAAGGAAFCVTAMTLVTDLHVTKETAGERTFPKAPLLALLVLIGCLYYLFS